MCRWLVLWSLALLGLDAARADSPDFKTGFVYDVPNASVATRFLSPEKLRDAGNGFLFVAGNAYRGGSSPNREVVATKGLGITYVSPNAGLEPDGFTRVGETIFFAAEDAVHGRELWQTNGTAETTSFVRDIGPNSKGSDPSGLIECQGKLLFVADDVAHGPELWVSDGTEAGTKLVLDINPGTPGSGIDHLFNWNGIVYFSARNATNNTEVWRTDGTPAGTYVLKEINPSTSSSSDPSGFTVFKGALYFQAYSGADGQAQLWKTNGTEEGTFRIKAIPSTTSDISSLTVVNDLLFFVAPELNHDLEVYVSDGTEGGTHMVRNIAANNGSDPHDLVAYNGELYFVANDRVNLSQIWKSDGTEVGTVMAHNIDNAGTGNPAPHALVVFDGKLLFQQTRDGFGMEWWQTDETDSAPVLVHDVAPGVKSGLSDGAFHSDYVVIGDTLFFSGFQSDTGYELWKITPKLTVTAPPAPQLVSVGDTATFQVTTSPATGVTVQWFHDNHAIDSATEVTCHLASTTLADAGNYFAQIKDGADTVNSLAAGLGVINRAVANATAGEGKTLSFTVQAAGPVTFQWKRNGTDLENSDRILNAKTASVQIKGATAADEGTYTCEVKLGALTLSTLPAAAQIVPVPVVQMVQPPPSIITGAFNWTVSATGSPSSFRITGLPKGLVYNAATGVVSGTPTESGNFQVHVTATNTAGPGAEQIFSLPVGALPPELMGSFGGLIERQTILNAGLGGSILTTIDAKGNVTSTVRLGLVTSTFKGKLVATVNGTATTQISLARRRQSPLQLSLQFNAATHGLGGTVSDGTESADLSGWQQTWAATTPALAYAGTYHVALDLPAASAGEADVPQGSGWVRMVVSATGAVSMAGQTGDGAKISFSGILGPAGEVPVFAPLYSGHGSILGRQQITPGGSAPGYADNRVTSAALAWEKLSAASRRDTVYAAGFDPIALESDGSKWSAPARGTNVLRVNDAPDNVELTCTGAGVEEAAQAESVDQIFELTGLNVPVFTRADNPARVSLKIAAATGIVTGGFQLIDPNPAGRGSLVRKAAYSGLVIPHRQEARGFFLLRSLNSSSVQSGQVILQPAQ